MSETVNLANAYVTLIPSLGGAQETITEALVRPATKAGDESGSKMGQAMKGRFNKVLAGLFTAGTVVAIGKGLFNIGQTFDNVTGNIRASTGATGDKLLGLVDVTKQVGKAVPSDFESISLSVSDLSKHLGLTGKDLETVTKQIELATNVLGQDISAKKAAQTFKAFKMETNEVSGAMDLLFQISQSSGVGIDSLAGSVKATAPMAQKLGLDFKETALMAGSLEKAGFGSEGMLTRLSRRLTDLAKDGEAPRDTLDRVMKKLEGLVESGDEFKAQDLARKAFGTRNAEKFVEAMKQGSFSLTDLGANLDLTGDTIIGVAEETMTMGDQWQIVKNNASAALEPLGSVVFDFIANSLTKVMPHLESLGEWMAKNQWMIAAIAGVVGVTLTAAFFLWAGAVWASTVALLANPVTLIILGIVGLVAILVALVKKWDSVVDWITNIWGGFVDWIKGLMDRFLGWWGNIWDGIKRTADKIWKGLVDGVKKAANKLYQWFTRWTLPGLIIKHWDKIWGTTKRVWDKIKNFFKAIPGAITGFFRGLGDVLVKPFRSGKDTVISVWGKVKSWFNSLKGSLRSAMSGVADILKGPFRSAFNGIASAWNNTVGRLSFNIPGWVPKMGGKGFSMPKIPALAHGGVLTAPGTVLVGEMGPELLRLPRGASVIPLDHPAAATAGPGGGALDASALARAVYAAVRDGMTGGSRGLRELARMEA